jgi:ATP/maltotriose-dependent transcriptional regulator MalT/DNA-binding SARP family transcriptional activator
LSYADTTRVGRAGAPRDGAPAQHRAADALPRPHLTERLREALGRGSLILAAPAGYGKTTALEAVLATSGTDSAIVYCTEEDADPGHLLLSILDALRRSTRAITDAHVRRLTHGTEPVDPVAELRTTLDELAALLVDPLTIVLEDAERLADSRAASRLVEEAITRPPPVIRTAVATRRHLPLRVAKPRAGGRLTEIDASELAFDAEEAREFLRGRHGREPSREDLELAMNLTEGWPLGIALLDLARRHGGPAMTKAQDALFDFLAEEVLESLEEDLKRSLVESALFEELDPGLIRAMDLPEDLLDTLKARLGRLVRALPVADGRPRYRYHPLLRELLLSHLAADRTPADRRQVHARAAGALQAAGRGAEAVEHWLDAEEWEQGAGAIAEAGPGLVRSAPLTVRRWIARLPSHVRGRPALQLLEGQLEYGAGNHVHAAELQRAALHAYEQGGDRQLAALTRIALVNTLHASGGFDEAITLADALDEPESLEDPTAPNLAVMAAMGLSHQGRFAEAAAMNRRAVEHPAAGPSLPLAKALEGLFLDRPAGRFDDAVRKAREALAELERSDPFERGPFVRALLHLVLEEEGHDELALRESIRAQEGARRIGVEGYLVAMLRLHSVGINARLGRLEEAQRELEAARRFAHGTGWRQVEVGQATLAWAQGEQREAVRLAEDALERIDAGPFLQRIHAVAFLVPILVGCGHEERARAAVEATLDAWRAGYYRGRLLALRAWLQHLAGEGGWETDIADAWHESGDQVEHLVRREWPRLESVLWDALERGLLEASDVLTAIQRAFPGQGRVAPFAEHPVAEVRRAAVGPAVISGNPRFVGRLSELTEDPDEKVAQAARAATARLRRDPPPLSFRVLGSFRVQRGLWEVEPSSWRRPAAARLVRLLLAQGDEPVPEDRLFEALWPGKELASARRALQVAASDARRALDLPGSDSSVIEVREQAYRLRLREGDRIDAADFDRAASVALAERRADLRIPLLGRAVGMWTGEPFPEDRYEDWATVPRERLRDRLTQVMAALVLAHRGRGDVSGELDAARRLVELDPLNEVSQRELMTAYARAGRRGDALRQYLECRRALVDALGVEPAGETRRLHAQILAGETP